MGILAERWKPTNHPDRVMEREIKKKFGHKVETRELPNPLTDTYQVTEVSQEELEVAIEREDIRSRR